MPITYESEHGDIQDTDVKNSVESLTENSPLFRSFQNYIIKKDVNVLIKVTDDPVQPGAVTRINPVNSAYDYEVIIPKQEFDGNPYTGTDNNSYITLFERILSHEYFHILDHISDGVLEPNDEVLAESYADDVMEEAFGEVPNQGTGSFGDNGNGPPEFGDTSPIQNPDLLKPNYKDPVPNSTQGIGDDLAQIPTGYNPFVSQAGGADPLVFDLDKDGLIELTSVANSGVFFDYLGEGYAEKSGWVSADDGMLTIDLNGDGFIDNITELFGSEFLLPYLIEENFSAFQNEHHGFARLGTYDSNGDDKIDALDDVWSDLRIWQDVNQNGISESGELLTLSSLDIVNIDLSSVFLDSWTDWSSGAGASFSRIIEGNVITHSGLYTLSDNSTYEVADVWFETDLLNTFDKRDFDLDIRTLFLPKARGYGELPDLVVAMSNDNGTGGLLEQVSTFTQSQTLEGFFNNFETVRTDVKDILFNWAGIDETASTTYRDHGVWGDMPEYAFLRVILGQNSEFHGSWFDGSPNIPFASHAIEGINTAFNVILDNFTARLGFQAFASEVFEDVSYNPLTDSFEVNSGGLSQTAIQTLEVEATNHSDVEGFWYFFAKYVDAVVGVTNLTTTEEGWIDTAIANSSSSALDWSDILLTLNEQNILGTSASETITGTRYDDVIDGEGGDDTLIGGEGNDYLIGLDGTGGVTNTTLIGGEGNDILSGGPGNDTFVYDWGHDVIITGNGNYATSDTDILLMGTGISASDVSIHMARTDTAATEHYIIQVEGRGTITVEFTLTASRGQLVDEIHFVDDPNTVLIPNNMDVTVHGTNRDDSLTDSGLEGTHTFYGYDGDDNIGGQIAFIADGGEGDDYIGGTGFDDVFYLSSGTTLLYESGGSDKMILPEGYDASSITFYRTDLGNVISNKDNSSYYDDVVIGIDGVGYFNIIDGLFSQVSTNKTLETVELFNGTQIDPTTFTLEVRGTSGDDYIDNVNPTHWSNHDDVYIFSSGNDIIYETYANDGVDTIKFENALTFDDLILERRIINGAPVQSNYNLTIDDRLGNTTLIQNQFKYSNPSTQESGFSIEKLAFSDGSVINIFDLEIDTIGTELDDVIEPMETGDASNANTIYGLGGNDQLRGGSGDDVIWGGAGDDTLSGREGDDIFITGTGNDTITSNVGNDIFIVGLDGVGHTDVGFDNSDTSGYAGRDKLHVGFLGALSMADITIAANNFYNTDMTFADGSTAYFYGIQDTAWTASDFIFAIGGTAAGETLSGALNNDWDAIYGFDGDDFLYGRGGRDALHGGLGVDRLEGGEGDDWLYGDEGNDTLAGQEGDDYIEGGDGNDTVYGNEGHDEIHGGLGADALWGLEGRDVIYGGDGDDGIYGDHRDILTGYAGAGDDELHGGAGNDNIKAGEGDDLAYGDDGADSIYGNDGNDTLWGGTGYDYLYGGEGQDVLYGEDGEDQLRGNEGNDILDGGDHKDTIYGDDGDDILDGGIGNYRDNLAGGAGNDTLYGREGNDYLYGDNDDDILYGGDGVDNLRGNYGNDILYGEDGWDFLDGDEGNDFLYGGAGNDQLSGDDGNDLINGGTGLDNLYGHSGNDTFAFYAGDLDGSRDYIMDWSNGSNIIDISDVINYSSENGDNIFDFVQFNAGSSYTRINIDEDGTGTSSSWTAVTQIQNTTGLDIQTMIANGSLIVE
ncbi:MAG: hypothetical protein CMH25_04020 [Micavibrio sp.]|nr:hypothetical protein [Micavibrio sp.]